MQETRLTPTSYIVLGLVAWAGEATPYDLKRLVSVSVGNFWSIPHSQLYAEPERLTAAGLLSETRERSGRRRRRYSITPRGRDALQSWTADPVGELAELRDPALLKLFFGGDPAALARGQIELLEAKLAEYEQIKANAGDDVPRGPLLALEAGITHARTGIEFWRGLL